MQFILNFLSRLYRCFIDRNCTSKSANLAYMTLLTIVPLMLVVFYALSLFPALQNSGKQIEQFILNNFVASSAQIISQELQIFLIRTEALSWASILSLGIFAILLIYNIIVAVNNIWEVKLRWSFALSSLLYFIILLIFPMILGVLLLFSSYLSSLPILSHLVQINIVRRPFLSAMPFFIEFLVFSLFNWAMPNCSVKIFYACVAGFITMILFEVAKFGFVTYLHFFPDYKIIYGALATIPIFLIWIYLSWVIILLGTLICHLLQTK